MNGFIALELLSILFFSSLLVFVLSKKRDRQTVTFSFLLGSVAIWQLGNVLLLFSRTAEDAIIRSKIVYLGVILISLGFYHVALRIAQVTLPRFALTIVYGLGLVFAVLFLTTDYFLNGINHYAWGYWTKAGPLHPLYVLFYSCLFVIGLSLLFRQARVAQTKWQQHVVKRVFWALLLGAIGSVDYLPTYGVNVYPFGFIPAFAAAVILAYLIVFRGLMAIEVVNWRHYYLSSQVLNFLLPYQRYVTQAVGAIHVNPGEEVLSVGCGAAAFSSLIQKNGGNYAEIEHSETVAKTISENTFREKELLSFSSFLEMLQFASQTFDKILCVDWLHLLPLPERSLALLEYRRILKPRGLITIIVPIEGSNPLKLYSIHFLELTRKSNFFAACLNIIKQFSALASFLYYSLVIMRRQEVLGLVDFLNGNQLLVLLRQNGFDPIAIRRTCEEQVIICVGQIKEISPAASASKTSCNPQAISALKACLGESNVHTEPISLRQYQYSTSADARAIDAVLVPHSVEQLQQTVRLANKYRLQLYPISTGHNWGYGTASPVRDHGVVVDLSRMNRILEVNSELAYVVVEPGVTQGQLSTFLEENDIPLWIDSTGAGPNCSLIGNALERGFGLGRYSDHFLSMCGMEVIIPNGEVVRTGFGSYEKAKATNVYKWGVGPALDGLFTQSNFGIVTKIGLWLAPKPEYVELAWFQCFEEDRIGELIEALRELVIRNVVDSAIKVSHRNTAIAMLQQYPWDETSGLTPLPESLSQNIAKRRKIAAWNGVIPLYGSKIQVQTTKIMVRRILKNKVDKLIFTSDKMIRYLDQFRYPLGILLNINVPEVITLMRLAYGMAKGNPNEHALRMPYWRNTGVLLPSLDLDPGRDQCGLIWFAPIIPMTKSNVDEFLSIVRPIYQYYRFEACVGFTTVTTRAVDCTLPILFDQFNPDEVKRAHECYAELLNQCVQHGYVPYRLHPEGMDRMTQPDNSYWSLVETFKNSIDPQGIISPGRYCRN
uniref:FAD/FMN-containing dehydrogenase n=1 Tax=uncultured bacterium CSL142 TaxID=1091569 RepID=G4WVM1_9BACT|nr:FAD/FMN-containing dehydrogenase [uncultured bacterium CSL142]